MLRGFLTGPFLDGDSGGGGGGTGGDPAKTYKDLLDQHNGNASALAMALLSDNFQWRDKNRTLATQLETATRALPAEGSLVLTPDQKATWEKYLAHGTPEQLDTLKTEVQTLKSQSVKDARDRILQEAAQLGWNLPALRDLMGDVELKIEEVETNDGKVKQAQVKDGEKFIPLEDLVSQRYPHFAAALRSNEDSPDDGNEDDTSSQQNNTGISWINHGQGDRQGKSSDVIGDHLGRTYKLPSQRKTQGA